VKREDELIEKALKGQLVEKTPSGTGDSRPGVRTFSILVGGDFYNVEVEEVGGGRPRIRAVGDTAPIITKEPAPAKEPETPKKEEAKPKEEAEPKEEAKGKNNKGEASASGNGEHSVTAPMPGMVVQFEVKVGDAVKEGDVLVILEAMKMQNNLTAKVSGVVKSLKVSPGTSVEKDQVLLIIAL